jgi:hypothetical protein
MVSPPKEFHKVDEYTIGKAQILNASSLERKITLVTEGFTTSRF